MPQNLQKLMIQNQDESGSTPFPVMFNPTEYAVDDAAKWTEQPRKGQLAELQYTGLQRRKLSLELFFDTYERKVDVRTETAKIANLMVMNREKHRPPKVLLTWGDVDPAAHKLFPFTGVMQSLKQQFILFMSDGKPVRAKLTAGFTEFSLPVEDLRKNQMSSPDRVKTYRVKVGDTLSGIAGLFYQDPRVWRPIAIRNDVADPRQLVAGQVLTIPRLD
ncbi:MAG: hypothetical protein DMF84_31025 [Acidobacteria bacterium]|nr:MAG: hypothetical protein DMF84_31025 [Acidobacteriota bacterium]